jgi:EamA domain-containing membrane protein RarD
VFQLLQGFVLLALQVLVLALCVVGLVDAARRPAAAFVSAGKRTKNFWLAVLGVATAIAFVGIGGARFLIFIVLAAVASIVYLVDVKPAVTPYSGGRGGSTGPSRGW